MTSDWGTWLSNTIEKPLSMSIIKWNWRKYFSQIKKHVLTMAERRSMSILLDAEASFSKFLRTQIMGLVWFNSFNSWSPEGREWSSLQFCAWHFLLVKCLSGNKSQKSGVSPEAAAECQDRMFFYWVTYQPPGMHLGLFGWGKGWPKMHA